MQTIDEERDVLLGVLLIKADELFAALPNNAFEVARDHWAIRSPHAVDQETKSIDQLALECQWVAHIDLLQMELTLNEVLVEDL